MLKKPELDPARSRAADAKPFPLLQAAQTSPGQFMYSAETQRVARAITRKTYIGDPVPPSKMKTAERSFDMRNRVFGLVVTTVLVLTAVENAPVAHAQRQSKCDVKKELEGANSLLCGPVLHRRICPVLMVSNKMLLPNLAKMWDHPFNFEAKPITGSGSGAAGASAPFLQP